MPSLFFIARVSEELFRAVEIPCQLIYVFINLLAPWLHTLQGRPLDIDEAMFNIHCILMAV